MDELILYFAVVFGIRYSRKSKIYFLTMLNNRMKTAGYKEAAYNKGHNSKGRQPPEYVVYGNLKQAKVVFISSYDTGSRIFVPNCLYYPLNEPKNSRFERLNGMIELALVLFCIGLCAVLLYFTGIDLSFTSIKTFYTLAPVAVFSIIVYKITDGLPNSPNFNRNSAALMLMYAIARDPAAKKNAAFVFCNKSCSSHEGYIRFALECPKEIRHKIVLLDCIGYGTRLLLAHRDTGRGRAAAIMSCKDGMEITDTELPGIDAENTILKIFPESLLLFSADEIEREYVVQNTRNKKDRMINTARLEQLKAVFLEFIRVV
jgi:hypothetical protein